MEQHGRRDGTECHEACHYACRQVRVSRSMKSDRQALGLAQRALTLRGLLASVHSLSLVDQRNETSLQVSTSPVLSATWKSSRRQQRSEPRTIPSIITQINTSEKLKLIQLTCQYFRFYNLICQLDTANNYLYKTHDIAVCHKKLGKLHYAQYS